MNILQISAPKSGSFWLHSILVKIWQEQQLSLNSFIQKQPIYDEVKDLSLTFKGQAGVDMIDIEEDGCYYRISSIFREKIDDLEHYAKETSLAWTHSTFCNTSYKAFPLFDKKIFIVRDPRDRALSASKFAFSEYMQKYRPTHYASAEEFLAGEYERLLEQWVWYVGNYLLHKEELDIHFVFYERLLNDFDNEFQSLLKYLEVDLTRNQQQHIAEAVTFSSMKEESPKHLNKGSYGKWIDQLDKKQQETAIEKAGTLMELLHYPLTADTNQPQLPKLPITRNHTTINHLLEEINWKQLF